VEKKAEVPDVLQGRHAADEEPERAVAQPESKGAPEAAPEAEVQSEEQSANIAATGQEQQRADVADALGDKGDGPVAGEAAGAGHLEALSDDDDGPAPVEGDLAALDAAEGAEGHAEGCVATTSAHAGAAETNAAEQGPEQQGGRFQEEQNDEDAEDTLSDSDIGAGEFSCLRGALWNLSVCSLYSTAPEPRNQLPAISRQARQAGSPACAPLRLSAAAVAPTPHTL
jgi:hypothetical protein